MTGGRAQQTKRCVSCGGNYFLEFFRRSYSRTNGHSANEAQSYRDRCMGCEASIKKEVQADRSLRRKAKGTMDRHAASLKRQGKIRDYADLEELYGWSLDRMVKDIKHVLSEGCSYCFQKVDATEQRLRVVTLDIFDPQKPPDYNTNVKWCCKKCNSEKGDMAPEVWGARSAMWGRWHRHQDRLKTDPEAYGFLALDKIEDQPPLF